MKAVSTKEKKSSSNTDGGRGDTNDSPYWRPIWSNIASPSSRQPAVMPPRRAAKAATADIPVVFTIGGDPVELGLVASFNRPGGNLTGLTQYTAALEGKRLEVLHELMPSASAVALLVDPGNPNIAVQMTELPTAARKMNLQLTIVEASTEREIDEALARFDRTKFQALFVASDPFFNSRREQIVARVAALAIPAIFHQREFAIAGGLISYGSSAIDMYRQAGL